MSDTIRLAKEGRARYVPIDTTRELLPNDDFLQVLQTLPGVDNTTLLRQREGYL